MYILRKKPKILKKILQKTTIENAKDKKEQEQPALHFCTTMLLLNQSSHCYRYQYDF